MIASTTCPYEEIESALLATARGREFLAEHARRARGADTESLIGAVARLERRLFATRLPEIDVLADDLDDLSTILRDAKADPEHVGSDIPTASPAMQDGIGPDGDDVAELIQETAWAMREGGFDAELCDRLDGYASEIGARLAETTVSNRRAIRLEAAFAALTLRIEAMNESWGLSRGGEPHLLPETLPTFLEQDLDFVRVDDEPNGGTAIAGAGDLGDLPGQDAASVAVERLALLGTRERLRLFS